MIDPQARIARPAACLVIPEGVALVIERMNLAERVDPALIDQPSEGGTAFGMDEGIIRHRSARKLIAIFGADYVVARQARTRVGSGQGVSERVDFGGRRHLPKK